VLDEDVDADDESDLIEEEGGAFIDFEGAQPQPGAEGGEVEQ
jgi:hypothetical protein